MPRSIKKALAIGILCTTIYGCGEDPGEVARRSDALVPSVFKDATGTVEVQVKTCAWTDYPLLGSACYVDSGYVLIGGGAEIEGSLLPGALLRGSFPNPDDAEPEHHPFSSWVAVSQNFSDDAHRVRAYAIGLKLAGMTPDDLIANRLITDNVTNTSSTQPSIQADFLSPGYTLTGGGAHAVGYGTVYLRSSRPQNNSWFAAADSGGVVGTEGDVKSYVIGLKHCPTYANGKQWGCLSFAQSFTSVSSNGAYPKATVKTPNGYALVGIGASANDTSSTGRELLTDMIPFFTGTGGGTGATAFANNPVSGTGGKVNVWAFGIKKQ